MIYKSITDQQVLDQIKEWLQNSGELFIDQYYPYSGGSGIYYLISSMPDLIQLIDESSEDVIITILERQQFPIRGVVNSNFINTAVQSFTAGTYYLVVDLETYPNKLSFYADGNNANQLQADLENLKGVIVGIGIDPNVYIASENVNLPNKITLKK